MSNGDKINLSLLEAIEKSHSNVDVLDLRTLKKFVLAFERRLKENIEARLKYADQPERFADSEVNLHDELQKLKVLAGAPELIGLNAIPSILNLLSHDNTDIAIVVVQLLEDLTNEDVLEDNDEPAILLQSSTANQKRLGQMDGVDVLLQSVAMYKSKDPKSLDKEEMLENLFDCLCCLLMPLENKEKFVKAEGVELMIIIMKQKKYAYGSAIRALDFAMTN